MLGRIKHWGRCTALGLVGLVALYTLTLGQEKSDEKTRTALSPEVVSESMGIRFVKPDRLWTIVNEEDSGLPKLACLAEESDMWSPRFAVIAFPSVIMPNGMEARLRQVKISYADNRSTAQSQDTSDITASQLRILKFEKASLAGKEAVLFIYEIEGEKTYRTVEYGIIHQNNLYIVQAAAPTTLWEQPESAAMFERSFKSFAFLKSSPRK